MSRSWLAEGVEARIEQKRAELGRPTITEAQMFERKVKGDKLLVIAGMVFNISSWIRDHPGGEHVLLRSLSQDVTVQFQRVHAMSAHHKLVDLYECDLVDGSGASAPSPASALTSTGSLGAHPPPSPISLGLSSPIMRLPMLSPASSLKPTSPLLPLPRSVEVSKEIRNVDILSSQLGTPRSLSAAALAPPPPLFTISFCMPLHGSGQCWGAKWRHAS